jgi:hypothetical protein
MVDERTKETIRALTESFKQVAIGMTAFVEGIKQAAGQMARLHRAIVLYVRHHYVEAGKPYGNGYAAMMRWWRQQYPRGLA